MDVVGKLLNRHGMLLLGAVNQLQQCVLLTTSVVMHAKYGSVLLIQVLVCTRLTTNLQMNFTEGMQIGALAQG